MNTQESIEMLDAIKDMFDSPEITVDCGRFVPKDLAYELLEQVPIKSTDRIAVMNSPEFVVYLLQKGVLASNITLTLHENCDNMKYIVENCIGVNYAVINNNTKIGDNMKFDVVIGNPPYSKGNHSSQVFWQGFALQGLEVLRKKGFMAMVHPARWRGVGQTSPRSIGTLGDKLKALDLLWLSIHDIADGQKYFKAGTRFDMYVVKKSSTEDLETLVVGDDKVEFKVNSKVLPLIPNANSEVFNNILCKNNNIPLDLLYNTSAYGSGKSNLHKVTDEKTEEHIYPCVYSISRRDGTLKFRYSNIIKKNEQGNNLHFGTPKVIFGKSQQSGIPYADIEGKYGLTEFAAAIVDEPEVLPLIAKAMNSDKFRNMMKTVQFNTEMWNRHVIKLFRKDFWKEFVDEKGNLL